MATWDITVPAGSGVGAAGASSSAISPPGDFDGATINSVAVQGTPALNSDGTTDDTIGIRWRIQTTGGTAVYGDYGSDAASLASAVLGDSVSSDTIADGSSPSPAPSTAVAADWDEIAYNANYAANMKDDGETCSWSSFTIRVTYTAPAKTASGAPNLPQLTAAGVGERLVPGSGAPTLPQLTANGTGTINPADVAGTGAPSLPQLMAVGVGERIIPGSGAPTLPQLTAAGVGEREVTSQGAPNLPQFSAAGVGERIEAGFGTPNLPQFTANGTGTVNGAAPPGAATRRARVSIRIGGVGI